MVALVKDHLEFLQFILRWAWILININLIAALDQQDSSYGDHDFYSNSRAIYPIIVETCQINKHGVDCDSTDPDKVTCSSKIIETNTKLERKTLGVRLVKVLQISFKFTFCLIKTASGSDASLFGTWTKGGPLLLMYLRWEETLLEATKNDWQGWYSGPKIKDQQCHVLGPKISPNTNLGPQ